MSTIRSFFRKLWLPLAAGGLVVLPSMADAAPRISFPWMRDTQIAIHARRALAEEPALARLNLGVNVRDGIATVWGPIPNDRVGQQAIKKVEQVKGVLQVHGDLYILGPKKADELIDLPFVFDAPTKSESASPDRESGKITNLTARPNPLADDDDRLGMGLSSAVALLPPIAISESRAPAPSAIAALAPAVASSFPSFFAPPVPLAPRIAAAPFASAAPVVSSGPVAEAIERLRRGDDRFKPIAAELKDGTVMLRAGTARGEHVMAFAQAISQVHGVERVVVSNGP